MKYEGKTKEAECGHSPCGRWKVYDILDGEFAGCIEINDTQRKLRAIVDNDGGKGMALLADLVAAATKEEVMAALENKGMDSGLMAIEIDEEDLKALISKQQKKDTEGTSKHDDIPPERQHMYGHIMGGMGKAEG